MNIYNLLKNVKYTLVQQGEDFNVVDVCYDTRKLQQDTVFVCIKGAKFDSHTLAKKAVEQGAKAIVIEGEIEELPKNITVVKVENSRIALAFISAEFFGNPAQKLITIGVTGSKGKTTVTYMMKKIFDKAGIKTGLIGSIGALIGDEKAKTINTTPESYEIQKLYSQMVEAGCKAVLIEVSSQGLMLNRTAGFTFDYGIFLNISRDHISAWEHKSLEEYLYCKSLLFKNCKVGLINFDDNKADEIIKDSNCEVLSFGFKDGVDYQIKNYHNESAPGYMGIGYTVEGKTTIDMSVGAPGKFSAYDSMVCAVICEKLGVSKETMKEALTDIKIRGRVETVDINAPYTVILDFAHNGIGIDNLVSSVREYNPNKIIAVFGSDGNRTKIRRADAGEILGNKADLTILTSNCPRFEKVEDINNDIKVGLDKTDGEYIEICDRRTAIKHAMSIAQPNDVILLIGKGHWDYEEIDGVKYPFDERVVVKELLEEINAK